MTGPAAARLLLGSCPDSWGVWYADDPRQTPWQRFLDELTALTSALGARHLVFVPVPGYRDDTTGD